VEITGDPADSLKFKVPTLRNIALTGYFAHDGRYIAIGQLLDHYSSATPPSPTLDPLLVNGIPLTALQKFYIEEFLNTLTDSTLISNPRFD
jgi:cytochrome c peroxidase